MRDYTEILKAADAKIYLILQSNNWIDYISFNMAKDYQTPTIFVHTKYKKHFTFFDIQDFSDWLNKQNILKRRFR